MKWDWLQPLMRFKNWWLGELLACLPLSWRERLQGRDGALQLVLRPQQALLQLYQRGQWKSLESLDFDRADPESMRRLQAQFSRWQGQSVILVLPDCLVRELTVPLALEENLRSSLSYELDRYTPFKADQVHFDVVVLERDTDHQILRVLLVVALRRQLDHALDLARSLGFTVSQVTAANLGPVDWQVSLLRATVGAQTKFWLRPEVAFPVVVLTGLLATVLVFPLWQKYEYLGRLTGVVEAARQEAKVAETVRQELDQVVAKHNFPLAKKYKYPAAVQLLEEVSSRLPDDIWLSMFELKSVGERREIELRGEAPVTGKVITALETSALWGDLGVKTNPVKIANQPEIFHVGGIVRAADPLAAAQKPAGAVHPTNPAAPPASSVNSGSTPSSSSSATAPAVLPANAPAAGSALNTNNPSSPAAAVLPKPQPLAGSSGVSVPPASPVNAAGVSATSKPAPAPAAVMPAPSPSSPGSPASSSNQTVQGSPGNGAQKSTTSTLSGKAVPSPAVGPKVEPKTDSSGKAK